MSKVVIDSSVLIKWFLDEEYMVEARRIFDAYLDGALILRAPDLLNVEIGNIIWKRVIHRGMSEEDARDIMDQYIELDLNLAATADLLNDAYEIAVVHKRSVYDAMYVALSIQEQCPLITADEKLVNAVSSDFPNVVLLANWS